MQESDIKLYTEFQQCCSDHHKLQHVCLPRCLSDLVIKGSTDVLSHATWLFSGCGADHDDLEAFSQHSWDSVIRKKIFISWGKEFMMPGFLWVFVPGLISCLCRARCRLRGGFLMLFPFCWFSDVKSYSCSQHCENTGLIPLPDFPFRQKIHTVETFALSSRLTEIMQLTQSLRFGGEVVSDHLTHKVISSGNNVRTYRFIMTQHRQHFRTPQPMLELVSVM